MLDVNSSNELKNSNKSRNPNVQRSGTEKEKLKSSRKSITLKTSGYFPIKKVKLSFFETESTSEVNNNSAPLTKTHTEDPLKKEKRDL